MAMYDKFNRTLGKRVRNFYQDNKKTILGGITFAGLAGLIMGGSCYTSKNTDKQIEYLIPVWQESVDMPRSEDQTFRDNFYKVYEEQKNR